MYRNVIKPILDFIAALVILGVTSPVLIVITVLLAIAQEGRVWFMQQRPGRNGRPFNLLKFRSMNDKRDSHGMLLPDSQRLTGVGRWVRRLSLDELPQLLNVVKGEMSIVGPRPWLMEYLPLYNEHQRRRMEVRPGITGWAQVNGRNTADWKKRFELDVWYVDNQSFLLDLKILVLTILKVLKAEGISGETSVTMEKWSGN